MSMTVSADDFPAATARFDAKWRLHAMVLVGAWIGLLLLFHRDTVDLATIYWTNTTFGHCLFIAPVIGWLVWQRRYELAQLSPQGWLPGLAIVAAGGFAWVVGDAASVALFRHAGLVLMLQGAVVAILGPNVTRGLLFPIAYMAFLVPFGDFLEAPLQNLTTRMVMPLLHLFGVPAQVDGVLITTSNGFFEVAEACSGSKFVIAMVAFGVLVANVCYLSWRRRVAFLAMAVVVPIIANGLRAFGTIYAAWWTSVEQATGMDHIVYGWVFFAIVMAAVLALGWKWFDRDPDAAWFDPATLQGPVSRRVDGPIAALLVLTLASLFLGWGSLNQARAAELPPRVELPQVPGWKRVGLSVAAPWTPNFPGADHFLIGRYADAQGRMVDLSIAVFGNQHENKELVGFGIGAIRENDRWIRIMQTEPLAGGATIRMVGPGRIQRETVTWYRIGDALTSSARRVKLETLKAKMLGGRQSAVAVLLSAERTNQNARGAMEDFLRALGPVDRVADRMAGGR